MVFREELRRPGRDWPPGGLHPAERRRHDSAGHRSHPARPRWARPAWRRDHGPRCRFSPKHRLGSGRAFRPVRQPGLHRGPLGRGEKGDAPQSAGRPGDWRGRFHGAKRNARRPGEGRAAGDARHDQSARKGPDRADRGKARAACGAARGLAPWRRGALPNAHGQAEAEVCRDRSRPARTRPHRQARGDGFHLELPRVGLGKAVFRAKRRELSGDRRGEIRRRAGGLSSGLQPGDSFRHGLP